MPEDLRGGGNAYPLWGESRVEGPDRDAEDAWVERFPPTDTGGPTPADEEEYRREYQRHVRELQEELRFLRGAMSEY